MWPKSFFANMENRIRKLGTNHLAHRCESSITKLNSLIQKKEVYQHTVANPTYVCMIIKEL